MMVLCTGKPRFAVENGRIVLTVPSGKDRLQVAFTPDQTFALEQLARGAAIEALEANRMYAAREAEIVAFPVKAGGQPNDAA